MSTEERQRFKVWMANKAMIEIHMNQKFEMVSYDLCYAMNNIFNLHCQHLCRPPQVGGGGGGAGHTRAD